MFSQLLLPFDFFLKVLLDKFYLLLCLKCLPSGMKALKLDFSLSIMLRYLLDANMTWLERLTLQTISKLLPKLTRDYNRFNDDFIFIIYKNYAEYFWHDIHGLD